MILCIDTAHKSCNVALGNEDGSLIAEKKICKENSHAAQLHPLIYDLLKENKVHFHQLKAISCNIGPGSFSSLRIGLSCAKGLCYTLDIPLICFTSFDVLKELHPNKEVFYYHTIKWTKLIDNEFITLSEKEVFDSANNSKSIVLFGDTENAARILHFGISEPQPITYTLLPANALVSLAVKWFERRKFSDVAYVKPVYLNSKF